MKRIELILTPILFLWSGIACQADELDGAVQAVKQVLRQHEVPENWLSAEPEAADPLLLGAIWKSVDPDCAEAVKNVLGWEHRPRATLYGPNIIATNATYEEVVLRALFGTDHRHILAAPVTATEVEIPPNLRRDLLNPGGKVAFDRVAASLKENLSARPGIGTVDSRANPTSACGLISKWTQWESPKLDWVREGYAWRGVFICTIVSGKRELSHQSIQGPSRFAVTSFLDVGKRVGDSHKLIARSPAISEYALIPVGRKQLFLGAKQYRYVSTDSHFHPRLANATLPTKKSTKETTTQQDHYAYLVRRSPIHEHLENIHRDLWKLLSEPQPAVEP